jgi:OmpA-OmpF porin, OOP family
MANSIFTSIQEMVTAELRETLAKRMNESPQTIQAGLNAGIAAILGAISNRGEDSRFLNQFENYVRDAGAQNISDSVPSLVTQGLNGGAGEFINRFLNFVFDGDQRGAVGAVAQKAGVGTTTANSLLSMSAPMVLAYFSEQQRAGRSNFRSLAETLHAETASMEPWGSRDLAAHARSVGAAATTSLGTTELGDGPGVGHGAMLLLCFALIGAAYMPWMVYRSTNTRANMRTQPVTAAAAQAAVSQANIVSESVNSAAATAGVVLKTKLPDGTELSAPKGGTVTKLVDTLSDKSTPADRNNWMDLDGVRFGANDATLDPTSNDQLQNIAAVLKAYPNAKVQIGGFAEHSTDKSATLKLSEQRAKAVAAELAKMGVDKGRVSARGYGEQSAKAPAETEVGRQENGYVAVAVTQK